MATVGQALTAPEAGWSRYDDRHAALSYIGGPWTTSDTSSGIHNGTSMYTTNASGKILFKFKGTQLRLIGYRFTNKTTNGYISIDGGPQETFNEYGSQLPQLLMYERLNLEDKIHDVEIGFGSGQLYFDALDIDANGYLLPTVSIGQQLKTPAAGWRRYDDNHPFIKAPNMRFTHSALYGGSRIEIVNHATTQYVSFDFVGSKFLFLDYTALNRLPFNMKVDGIEEIVSAYGPGSLEQSVYYIKEGLPYGRHKVEIEVPVGSHFFLDAIDIDASGMLLHPDEVLTPEELTVGKRIRAAYWTKAQNTFGGFYSFTQDMSIHGVISEWIPTGTTSITNGGFYFICVEDISGKKKLIADRVIQNAISWNTINAIGLSSGKSVVFNNTTQSFYPKMIHADSDIGDDTLGDGSLTKPFKTLAVANAAASMGDAIKLKGTFTAGRGHTFKTDVTYIGYGKDTVLKGSEWRGTRVNLYRMVLDGKGYDEGATFTGTAFNLYNIAIINQYSSDGVREVFSGYSGQVFNCSFVSGMWNTMNNGTVSATGRNTVILSTVSGAPVTATSVAFDANYEITSSHKDLTGQGVNFDGSPAKLGVYGGPYSWHNKDEKVIENYMTIRLMTGGTSETDKNNDWDKYIVQSDLGGTITPGDNAIWNWNVTNLRSWTSTPYTDGVKRIMRGNGTSGSAPAGISAYWPTDSTLSDAARGFRPVAEITIVEPVTTERFLIEDDGIIKTIGNRLETIMTKDSSKVPLLQWSAPINKQAIQLEVE